MIEIPRIEFNSKKEMYAIMNQAIHSLMTEEKNTLSNLCNISGMMAMFLKDINWVGFYLLKDNELILGPFQGKPACTRIKIGEGVCGRAVQTKKSQRIDNVHAFPGHIACDSASNSELVVPLIKDQQVLGVIDIDSPLFSRFDQMDQEGIEALSTIIVSHIEISSNGCIEL